MLKFIGDDMDSFMLVEKDDTFEDLFSKYGCLSLEKQGNLFKLVGDSNSDLNIEKGTVKFGEFEFPVQILAMFNPKEKIFSWSWDNEEIGLPEDIIKESCEVKKFGEEHNIPQFITPMFSTDFKLANTIIMTVCSLFSNDSYCAVKFGDFVFFVTIDSDNLGDLDDNSEEFLGIYYDFIHNFDVDDFLALKSYADLKGYEFKEREDFSLVKINDDRVIVGFSERGTANSVKVLRA